LTGYDATRQSDPGFRVAERRRSGAAGERQAAKLAFERRLAEAIRSEVYPAAGALGFGPVSAGSGHREIGPDASTLVRRRDGWVEELVFRPGHYGGFAGVEILFFAQREGELRGGSPGQAMGPPPKRSLIQLFTGRNAEPENEALARAVREAWELLPHLDKHLREGTPHPNIRPADYYDRKVEEDED
jgi:hypothetical protein